MAERDIRVGTDVMDGIVTVVVAEIKDGIVHILSSEQYPEDSVIRP